MPFDLHKIGELLKATRIEKGLSLEDVSAELFIRKSKIKALETGDWDNLPHVVYTRGYIIQYATFLNVLDLVTPDLAVEEIPADEAQKEQKPQKQHGESHLSRRGMLLGGEGSNKKIAGAAVMACVLVAFIVFVNVQKPESASRPAPRVVRNTQQTVAPAPAPAPAPVEQKAPEATAEDNYQTVAGTDTSTNAYDPKEQKVVLEQKKLMIACQERTWVRVMIDGSEKKEFTLNPEEVVVLNAKESFDLIIGNAAGVKLFYNGKDTGFTGASGEVKRMSLS